MFITINHKHRIIFFIILIISAITIFCFLNDITFIPSSIENMEFRVVIDPGHGSIDTGTYYNNIYEKDINLEIAKFLEQEVKNINIIPIMTREKDKLYHNDRNEDLKNRPEIASENDADLYISLHVNNFPSKYPSGSQIFFKPGSVKSKKLAKYIQEELIKLRQENNREITAGNFYVLNKTPCPAVLIETGFLSNPVDRNKLTDQTYQKKIACAVKNGIVNYFQKQLHDFNIGEKNENQKEECNYDNLKVYYLHSKNNGFTIHKHNFIYPVGSFLQGDFHMLKNKEIIAYTLLKQLIHPTEDYISTLATQTKIKSLKVKGDTLTVNFSEELKNNFCGGAGIELLTIDTIKKTLFSIPGIEQIIILIEGKKEQSIGGHIILNKISKTK